MRWLFAFVLLLNVVYVVWQLNMPDVEDKPGSLTGNSPAGKDVQSKNVQSIVLLSELAASDEAEATELKPQAASMAAQDSIKTNAGAQDIACFSIGPFYQRKKLLSFKREMASHVGELVFQEREEARDIIYWVYIKPERNRQAAIALGKRLKANKIKDYYVIRQGDNNNGVSLGHFKDEKRANNVIVKVKKLGIEVTIEPLHKGESLFWLDFQVTSKQDDPETIVPEPIKAEVARLGTASKNKISLNSRRCKF